MYENSKYNKINLISNNNENHSDILETKSNKKRKL